MNYGIKRFITGFFFLSVIVLFSISSFAADKKYTATISKCEDKLILASCEKVKVWCDEGDGRACRALAGYWAQKKDFETANSFINLGCRMHDDKSCEIKQALSAQKDSVQEQQRQQLEQQRRQIAEMEEQQESLRRLQAVQALSNGVNQMFAPPVQPKKQRCRTVARPGNGLDGASAYYTTECD